METAKYQHYEVLRREDGSLWELGRGAMGVTYKAFDVNLRSFVALKVIRADCLDHPVARQRFIREARAAAQLRHRNIGAVFHLGADDAEFFYAMEFIDGETLDALVQRIGPLPAQAALRIALQVTRALAAAERRGVVHRDIKPGNLMILNEGEEGGDDEGEWLVKVIDFGLARTALATDSIPHLTVGGFVGTPQFASPEQLEEGKLDTRSDMYSLGVTLWFLLAGRAPFTGSLTNVISQHLSKSPPWHQLPPIPDDVRALLEHALQKDPARRPQTAADLRREIEGCLGIQSSAESGDLPRLGALSLSDAGLAVPPAGKDGPPLGTLVGDRYLLQRLVGEGHGGRVYEARDVLAVGHIPVAVKVFSVEAVGTSAEFDALSDAIDKAQDAPHPNIIGLIALERSFGRACLVMEWAGDRTLVDVLRKQGVVPPREALEAVRQAMEASEHARSHGLRPVELCLHQVMVSPGGSTAGNATGAAPDRLKFSALSMASETGDLLTWAGAVTIVPGRAARPEATAGSPEAIEARHIHALAMLFYELVEGTPPPVDQHGGTSGAGFLSLAPLGEAGNGVLRRALRDKPDFDHAQSFYEQMNVALPAAAATWQPAPASGATGAGDRRPNGSGSAATDVPFAAVATPSSPAPALVSKPNPRSWLAPACVGLAVGALAIAAYLSGAYRNRPSDSRSGSGATRATVPLARVTDAPKVLRALPVETAEPAPAVAMASPAVAEMTPTPAEASPPEASPADMSPTPAAVAAVEVSPSPADKENVESPAPEKAEASPRRTTGVSRSRRTRKSTPPNLFQRIFGAKPKSNRSSH